MQTPKYDLKLFVQDPAEVDLAALIPVFHGWIQTQALDDVLIDVADYRHVHHGPGVILVAHDAHYAMDTADGRIGLRYSRRRETHPSRRGIQEVTERLASVFRSALTACYLLEQSSALPGHLRFRGDVLSLRLNDRLQAPNTPEVFARFWADLEPFLRRLYAGSSVEAEYRADVKAPLTMSIRAVDAPDVTTLLSRLEAIKPARGVGV